MANTSNTTSAFAADEVAAAEANLQAAQARVAASKQQAHSNSPDVAESEGSNGCAQGSAACSAQNSTAGNAQSNVQFDTAGSVQGSVQGNSYQTSQPFQHVAPAVPAKSHVVAGVLAIFFGVFGIHKFYLGFTNEGFIMLGITIIGSLLSLGAAAFIVALMSVMEGLIYLIKTQKQFDIDYVYGTRKWL